MTEHKLTPEIIKALLEASRKDMEGVTKDIFEAMEVIIDANKKVAQILDYRISELDRRLKQVESLPHNKPATTEEE